MYCPAAWFASAPSAFWLTVAAPPSCPSVSDYCCTIPAQQLPLPTLPLSQHASVVRNVAPPCCDCNRFLPGTLPNSYTKGFGLTLPSLSPIPLPLTELSTPVAFVSLPTLIAPVQPPISVFNPRLDTLYCWTKAKLSSLTTLLLHSHRRTIFESQKQTP